jgi:hypothetical protein
VLLQKPVLEPPAKAIPEDQSSKPESSPHHALVVAAVKLVNIPIECAMPLLTTPVFGK